MSNRLKKSDLGSILWSHLSTKPRHFHKPRVPSRVVLQMHGRKRFQAFAMHCEMQVRVQCTRSLHSASNYTDYLELCLLIICEIALNGRMAPQAGFVWNVLERHVSMVECTLGKVAFKLWQLLCFAWQISASCSLAGRSHAMTANKRKRCLEGETGERLSCQIHFYKCSFKHLQTYHESNALVGFGQLMLNLNNKLRCFKEKVALEITSLKT